MIKNNFAVIGDKDKMLIFSLVGGEIFSPNGEKETRAVLGKLMTIYNQIYITSDYARYVFDILEDTRLSPYPIVTILPKDKDDDYAIRNINQEIKRTLGVELAIDENMENI